MLARAGLPVNVVITSSDPVPLTNSNLNSIATMPTANFSVTIPPQHIKSSASAAAPPLSFGAAFSSPSIVAALQNKNTTASSGLSFGTNTTMVTAKEMNPTVGSQAPTTQEQKQIFGSSITKPASSTPISSPLVKLDADNQKKTNDQPKTSDSAKPSGPFASFSFGQPAPTGANNTSFSLGGNQTQPRFSFGNLVQQQSSSLNQLAGTTSLSTSAAAPDSSGTGAANTSASSVREPDEEDNINFKPTAHFEPVIELPALVDVKTGEENETVLFEHRAKLLRYVKESKEVRNWPNNQLNALPQYFKFMIFFCFCFLAHLAFSGKNVALVI